MKFARTGRPPRLDRDPKTPLEVTASIENLISSPLCGITGSVELVERPDRAGDHLGITMVASMLSGAGTTTGFVGSSAFEPSAAHVCALGEAIERYALVVAGRHLRRTTASYRELDAGIAWDPRRLALPALGEPPTVPPTVPFEIDHAVSWLDGWFVEPDLSLRPALLPAQPLLPWTELDEPRFVQCAISGAATGNRLVEAVRSALIEVLERDAIGRAWLLRRRAPHIAPETISDPDILRWFAHHEARGRRPSLIWLTEEVGAPVVAAQLVEPAGPWRYIIGFGAKSSPDRALRRAVEDVENLRFLLMDLVEEGRRIPDDPEAIRDVAGQILFWQRQDRLEQLDFLLEPAEQLDFRTLHRPDLTTPAEELAHWVKRLWHLGREVAFADITPPELEHRVPLIVAKVLVAYAQPMRVGYNSWCLNNPTLGAPIETLNLLPPPII